MINIGSPYCWFGTVASDIKCLADFVATNILKVSIDEFKMLTIVYTEPHPNSFGRKALIGLR